MLVADHAMLSDVKREVDIMVSWTSMDPIATRSRRRLSSYSKRILKGHANIVNLIDSAWNRLPDGRYEVFILMEFCAGVYFALFYTQIVFLRLITYSSTAFGTKR